VPFQTAFYLSIELQLTFDHFCVARARKCRYIYFRSEIRQHIKIFLKVVNFV